MVLAFVCVASGTLLVVATVYDIVATVLHPQVESGLSNRFHRLVWLLLGVAARRRSGARREALLNWGLPTMVAGLIALWLILLLVGFGLLYYPWFGDPRYFDAPEGATGSLLEALYFSGTSLTTVGYGDFQATHGLFRALAIGEAACGFVVISLSVAYLLTVYPALTRARGIAVALEAESAGQPGALPLVRRYLTREGGFEAELADRLRELGLELLELTALHGTHPVLYYAHPPRVQHSFLRVLVTTQNLVGLLRYGLSPDGYGRIVHNPQLLLLEQALHHSLRELCDSLHIQPIEDFAAGGDAQGSPEEYDRLCDDLEQLGLVSARARAARPVSAVAEGDIPSDESADDAPGAPTARGQHRARGATRRCPREGLHDPALDDAAASPEAAYRVFRRETDPYLAAYAATCGYAIAQARDERGAAWYVGER